MEWSVVGRISAVNNRKGNAMREKKRDGRQPEDFSHTLARVAASARQGQGGGDGFAKPPDKGAVDEAVAGLWRYVAQVNTRLTDWMAGEYMPLT